jgi:ATP-dependent DNA helicase 2 subunit 2
MTGKAAFLAIIDCSMSEQRLSAACTIVQKLLQPKLWGNIRKTDLFGIITYATQTKNALHNAGTDYQGVTVAFPLETANLEMLKFLTNLKHSEEPADFMDALIVGVHHLMESTTSKSTGKPLKYDRDIVLITDAERDFPMGEAQQVAEKIDQDDINLNIVCMDDNLAEKSPGKIKNETLLKQLADAAGGSYASHTDALQVVSGFHKRLVNPSCVFRGSISFGSMASDLFVQCFNKTSEEKIPSAKRVSALGTRTGAISTSKTYSVVQRSEDNAGQELIIPKDELIRTQRYGQKLIPMSEADEEAQKLETTKGLIILGFVDQAEVGRHLFLNNTVLVKPEKGSQQAQLGVAGLAISLHKDRRVALVRYVARDLTRPRIGILYPHVTDDATSLMFVQLPFADDVREFKFDKLEDVLLEPSQRKTGKRHRLDHRAVPSTELNKRMDAWIESMDLMEAKDGEEAYQIKDIYNPKYHRVFDAVFQRAVDPTSPIPSASRFMECMQPIPKVLERSQPHLDLVKSSFQGVRRPVKQGAKRMQIADTELPQFRAVEQQMTVGTTDPIGDFYKMVQRRDADFVGDACRQMQTAIMALVDHLLGPRAGPVGQVGTNKILDSLRVLRDVSGEEGEDVSFNEWMQRDVKVKLLGGTDQEVAFWRLMKEKKYGLIDVDFANATKPVTKREADDFWREDAVQVEQVLQDYAPDVDMDDFNELA